LEQSLEAHQKIKGRTFLNEKLIKDRDFHLPLPPLSNAQVQLWVLKQLFDTRFLKYRGGYFPSPARSQTIAAHQTVFRYVVAREIKNARKALSDHISRAKTRVLKNLETVLKNRKINAI
jgi:DNA-binding GntR family transcriptional regulator